MFQSNYTAKQPDNTGYVHYTHEENAIWKDLYARQIKIIEGRACKEFLQGLKILNLPHQRIPQLFEINHALEHTTGWRVEPVPALIPYHQFFNLLAACKFPAATFIRRRDDFNYIKEPDIFHEFFGHCPMLTLPIYANFMRKFGELAKGQSEPVQIQLARLYWFTVEFGLIETPEGLRIYGGGILSSPEETVYALESPLPTRIPLDPKIAFSTDFRIDIKQLTYFIIKDYAELYQMVNPSLFNLMV